MSETTDLLEKIINRLDTLILTMDSIKTEIGMNSPSGIEYSLSIIQNNLFNIETAVKQLRS